jgi:two-component system, chemotaxis family, CheB/CheR fusion protein
MAFVVVQHLDPNHPSMLSELIAKATKLPVEEVKAGMTISRNHVYVIPPNAFMTVSGEVFSLTGRTKELGQHLAVNHFMSSLAETHGNRAIGVILSGTGADGTLGLESIKAEGGITFAQTPSTAQYDGMPKSAIESGCVDFVLPPNEIANELLRIQHHPYVVQEPQNESAEANAPQVAADDLTIILEELHRASGTDFSQYRPNTIHRRALRRMVILKLDSLYDYADYMKKHAEEGASLYEDILIPVTSFFRDSDAFAILQREVYPAIVKDKSNKGIIRMWTPGCSTGEETYSVAMSLLEFMGNKASSFQIQIFGTDLNEKGVQKARAGLYRESIEEEVSPERLQRFFVKVAGGYRVNKTIRDICIFARQNLVSDPPFSQMNLVACRNLLIYIQPVLQKKIIPILHYALKPTGFLLMGSSESLASYPDLFATVDKKQRIYNKKTTSYHLPFDFRQTYRRAELAPKLPDKPSTARDLPPSGIDAEADRIVLKSHAPAGVVVNTAMEIVQVRGRTTPYLELAPGKPTLNLYKVASTGLSIELKALMNAAMKSDAPVTRDGVLFDDNGQERILNLSASPIGGKGVPDTRLFLVLFERGWKQVASHPEPVSRKGGNIAKSIRESKMQKQELADARDDLHASIESEEALKEEFQSANEEILSANEELQSTNEELETSKEELQSANEELNTLNDELRNHNIELSLLSNDLSNLLDAIRIPIVFVGSDLSIRRFTSAATDIFRLLPSDIGRPFADIRHTLDIPDLTKIIEYTVAHLVTTEREVQDASGRWRSLEIRPYKTADNRIEGAIIALPDIDRIKNSEQYLKQIIDNVPNPLLVLDAELNITLTNLSFCRAFGVSQAETAGQPLYRLGNEQWNIPQLKDLLEDVLPKEALVRDYVVTHKFPAIGWKTMLLSGQRIQDVAGGGKAMILLAVEDITQRRDAEEYQKQLLETHSRLAAIIDSSDDAIISKNLDGTITSWNHAASRIFGYETEEIIGHSILQIIPEHLHPEEAEFIRRLKEGERIAQYETTRIRKDGKVIDVSLTLSPVKNDANEMIGTSKIARDISGRKTMETLVIQADKLATMGRMAATIAHEVNNPLESVLNLIFLARTNNGTPEAAAYLLTAEAEIARVSHIARQTLGYYRDLGAPVELFLHEVVEEVLRVYQSKLQTRGIRVEREYDKSRPITLRKGEVMQVFSNVISNAIDSMNFGGLLSIKIMSVPGTADDGLQVIIQDQGAGIGAENVARVFEPFFTTKGNLGTGIGLWVAKQLAEKQSGEISLTSNTSAEAHGTCVVIFLPFAHVLLSTGNATRRNDPAADKVHLTEIIRLPDLLSPMGRA